MSNEPSPANSLKRSTSYLVYSLSFGIALFMTIFYSGFNQWPVLQTIFLGSLVQYLFSISKKSWRNQFSNDTRQSASALQANLAFTIVIGYTGSLIACSTWYGMGWLLA